MSNHSQLTSIAPEFGSTSEIEYLKAALKDAQQEILSLRYQLTQTQLSHHLAVEMGQFKAGYLARTSHELRSPLNSLIGIHQMILSDLCDDPAEEREFIAQAHESALRLVGLLDRVIDVAKVEEGRVALEIQPFPLLRIFQEVNHLTGLQVKNRNLKLDMTWPDKEVYGLADPRCLRQVLLHLLETAIELAQDRIQVIAHVDPDNGYIHIDLGDDRPQETWQEAIDLMAYDRAAASVPQMSPDQKPSKSNLFSGYGFNLLIAQMLLGHMQGQLTLLPVDSGESTASPATTSSLTRLRCSIPLLIPDEE